MAEMQFGIDAQPLMFTVSFVIPGGLKGEYVAARRAHEVATRTSGQMPHDQFAAVCDRFWALRAIAKTAFTFAELIDLDTMADAAEAATYLAAC
jgi:hypothetical protein